MRIVLSLLLIMVVAGCVSQKPPVPVPPTAFTLQQMRLTAAAPPPPPGGTNGGGVLSNAPAFFPVPFGTNLCISSITILTNAYFTNGSLYNLYTLTFSNLISGHSYTSWGRNNAIVKGAINASNGWFPNNNFTATNNIYVEPDYVAVRVLQRYWAVQDTTP